MAHLKLITPPAEEPISLTEARLHLRLTATGSPATHPEDALVTSLIKAVRGHLDGPHGRLERCLVPQTWECTLDCFPPYEIQVPVTAPCEIVSIKYDDSDGVEQTVAASNYVVDNYSQRRLVWVVPVAGFGWPSTLDSVNAVRIRFTAGFPGGSPEDGSGVPLEIKQAMLLMLAQLFENRGSEESKGWPAAADAFLSQYEHGGPYF
jgi:uncharacterized phiE125 gp8 family phage protein